MARTTLDLDPVVLRRLRERARRDDKSMGQVASELLTPALDDATPDPPPFIWTTANLGLPLVDLEDREAVRRALDAS